MGHNLLGAAGAVCVCEAEVDMVIYDYGIAEGCGARCVDGVFGLDVVDTLTRVPAIRDVKGY